MQQPGLQRGLDVTAAAGRPYIKHYEYWLWCLKSVLLLCKVLDVWTQVVRGHAATRATVLWVMPIKAFSWQALGVEVLLQILGQILGLVLVVDFFLAAVVPPVAALSSLRYDDFWTLSATGCVPLSALVKYVAVCGRVCWHCHQAGGTDVVDLPDVWLPDGQYLDMFDSESDHSGDLSDYELVEAPY